MKYKDYQKFSKVQMNGSDTFAYVEDDNGHFVYDNNAHKFIDITVTMCGYSNYRTSSGCGSGGCGGNYNEFRTSNSCGGYIRPVTSGCGGGC